MRSDPQLMFQWWCCEYQGSAVENSEIAMTRLPSDDEPFSGLAFKVMSDQFLGTLTFVRVYRCSTLPHTNKIPTPSVLREVLTLPT